MSRWARGCVVGGALIACGTGETPRHPTGAAPNVSPPGMSAMDVGTPSASDLGAATSSAPTPAASGTSVVVSPSAPASASVQPAVTSTTLSPPTTTATAPDVPQEYAFDDYYPKAAAFSLLEYKRTHHLLGPTFEQRCWDLGKRVGAPVAGGLLCLTDNRRPLFTLARIYRIEGSRLRQVWQAVVNTYANWLELTPVLSEDGGLVLHDQSPGRCEGALGEYQAKLDALKAPPSGELLGPACAKRGKYEYEGRQYRLTEPVRRREFPW